MNYIPLLRGRDLSVYQIGQSSSIYNSAHISRTGNYENSNRLVIGVQRQRFTGMRLQSNTLLISFYLSSFAYVLCTQRETPYTWHVLMMPGYRIYRTQALCNVAYNSSSVALRGISQPFYFMKDFVSTFDSGTQHHNHRELRLVTAARANSQLINPRLIMVESMRWSQYHVLRYALKNYQIFNVFACKSEQVRMKWCKL